MAIKFEVAPSDTIDINVLNADDYLVKFRMKRYTLLGKLMKVYSEVYSELYSETIGFEEVNLRFYFDESRICGSDTPSSLKMKDGDLIIVYKEQIGGTN